MTQQVNHKPLILAGCLIWIISFLGETFGYQPYSTIGIVISPILTIVGLFYWFKFYKLTRGHYPKFWAIYKDIKNKMYKNPFAGITFMFKHILETWTFTIVFWMGLATTLFITFRQSDAFEVTRKYCERDKVILAKTGKIKYYGLLVGGSMTTQGQKGNANLSFTIFGEKGIFSANSELTKSKDEWTVESLTVR
jgi:hypothetical protein